MPHDRKATLPADHADGQAPPVPTPPRSFRNIAGLLVIIVVLVVGGRWGYHYWQKLSQETSTDDAYITADISQVSSQVSGTITQVLVHDNQVVKPGDLLMVLDESSYKAAVEQAQANLEAAIAAARGATVNVNLTAQTGNAQETQAQGVVEQAQSSIGGAQAELDRSRAGLAKSTATVKEAQANIATAQAGVEAASANRRQTQAAVDAAAAQVATARGAIRAAEAGVAAAKAEAERTNQDVTRYQALLKESAISRQVVDNAMAAAEVSRAKLDSAREQVQIAKDTLEARNADLEAAKQKLLAADAAVNQAAAQLGAAREHTQVVATDVNSARAAEQAAGQSIKQAQAKHSQALGQLAQARTTHQQVAISNTAQAQAQAKIDQAVAALKDAQIKLNRCRIYAGVGGTISKKTATVGALVQPGSPLMAIVLSDNLWVVANYKETQLARMLSGQEAIIEVDALRKERFRGRLDSIAPATGATFALLPPENASGNFTKIVQRVPVKIVFEPGQRDWDRLRGGMSVKATMLLNSAQPTRGGSVLH